MSEDEHLTASREKFFDLVFDDASLVSERELFKVILLELWISRSSENPEFLEKVRTKYASIVGTATSTADTARRAREQIIAGTFLLSNMLFGGK